VVGSKSAAPWGSPRSRPPLNPPPLNPPLPPPPYLSTTRCAFLFDSNYVARADFIIDEPYFFQLQPYTWLTPPPVSVYSQERVSRGAPESSIPPEFFCPITQDLMSSPYCTVDGFSYERVAIQVIYIYVYIQ